MRALHNCLAFANRSHVINVVEAACRFRNVFVAHTLHKFLENASKVLPALRNDCSVEVFRFFDALFLQKMYEFSMQITKFLKFLFSIFAFFFIKSFQKSFWFRHKCLHATKKFFHARWSLLRAIRN